jgi:hypothetical protein
MRTRHGWSPSEQLHASAISRALERRMSRERGLLSLLMTAVVARSCEFRLVLPLPTAKLIMNRLKARAQGPRFQRGVAFASSKALGMGVVRPAGLRFCRAACLCVLTMFVVCYASSALDLMCIIGSWTSLGRLSLRGTLGYCTHTGQGAPGR